MLFRSFLEVELAGEALRPISKKKALFGKVAGVVRKNFDVEDDFDDEFDTGRLLLRGGISFLGKRSTLRLPIQYENIWLNSADTEDFRRIVLAGIEWERSLGASDRIMPFGQLGAVRYPDQSFRDVNLGIAGATWIHRFARANREFRLGLYYGNEDNEEDSVAAKAIARDYVGLFGLFQWNPTPRQLFFVNATLQASDYDGLQPVFGEVREDDYYALTVGWNWRWRPKWTINVEVKYENQESNLDIFTYDRTQVFGGVRFDFR